MSTVSSSLPAQPYLALPSPASFRPGGARPTAGKPSSSSASASGSALETNSEDYVELAPVAPVSPVTRQPQQPEAESDQANKGGTGSGSTRTDAGTTPVGQRTAAFASTTGTGQGPSNQPRVTVGSATGQANTGFITQSLSQETIGAGLHIEPWRAAISSYLSAAALPTSAWSSSLVSMTV